MCLPCSLSDRNRKSYYKIIRDKPVTLSQNQSLFAKDVAQLITYIFSEGYTCTLGEAFRTKEQAEIYAKSGLGIAHSLHCERLAIDLNIFKPDGTLCETAADYERFGCFWESLDAQNNWGGRWGVPGTPNEHARPDSDHFQRKPLT